MTSILRGPIFISTDRRGLVRKRPLCISYKTASRLEALPPIMRSSMLPVVVATFGMVNLAFAAPNFEVMSLTRRAANFASTCKSVSLSGWTLNAQCEENDTIFGRTVSLNLNSCLAASGSGVVACNPQQ